MLSRSCFAKSNRLDRLETHSVPHRHCLGLIEIEPSFCEEGTQFHRSRMSRAREI